MTVELRVELGAAVLDERMPGWANRICLELLDIGCGGSCILGQLFGEDYHKGVRQLVPELRGADADNWAIAHGFCWTSEGDWMSEIPLLTEAWLQAVRERQFAVAPQPELVLA